MCGQWETIRRQDVGKADTPCGRQWERKGNNGGQWETRGDKTPRRRVHHPRKENKKGDGRQWKTTRGDKTLGRRRHHPTQAFRGETMGDKGRQDLGKADMPSNTGTRQWQTREKPKKADIPSQAHMWGDNGRQKEATRRREGERTMQHRHACVETMGDNGREGREKTSRRQTHHPGTHVRRQRETSGDKRQDQGGHLKNALRTPRAVHCLENKKGDNV